MGDDIINPLVTTYTKLLRHRVAYKGHIDFNFILEGQAWSAPRFEEHLGRFIGWFTNIEDSPSIVLLAREIPGGSISHVYLLQMNHYLESFPIVERCYLSRKLQGTPRFVMVNLISPVASILEYAILMESAYLMLSRDIFKGPDVIYVRYVKPGSFQLSPEEVDFAPSSCRHSNDSISHLVDLMKTNRLILGELGQPRLSSFFNVLRIPYDGHFIYGVSYRQHETLLLLVPTTQQAPSPIHLEVLRDEVTSRFPDLFKAHYVVRLRVPASCVSQVIMKACILLSRVPLLYIDPSDIELALEELDTLSIGGSQEAGSQASTALAQRHRFAYNPARCDPEGVIIATLSVRSRNPSQRTTQSRGELEETTIRTQQHLRRELGAYRAWMAVADNLEAPFPSSIRARARSMATKHILREQDWMMEQISAVALCWEAHTTVKVLELCVLDRLSRHHIDDKTQRFVIMPIKRDDKDDYPGLMIFDRERCQWGWVHSDNSAAISESLLTEVKDNLALSGPRYASWRGHIVILTSSYHKDYPYVHLVMALYYIGKLFTYSVQIPAKVVYPERSFRQYCYYQCLAVQVANQEHNLENGLIGSDGDLTPGAFVSLPSPVQFERAVVPSDLCGFCKKRGFNNLGRHMSMAHGGQALMANQLRQIQYGYTSSK